MQIMGLAAIVPQNYKVQNKFYKEMYGKPDTVRTTFRLTIHFLVNFVIFEWLCILLTIGSIYTRLGNFVKLGLRFMTRWINSC